MSYTRDPLRGWHFSPAAQLAATSACWHQVSTGTAITGSFLPVLPQLSAPPCASQARAKASLQEGRVVSIQECPAAQHPAERFVVEQSPAAAWKQRHSAKALGNCSCSPEKAHKTNQHILNLPSVGETAAALPATAETYRLTHWWDAVWVTVRQAAACPSTCSVGP